MEDLKDVYDVIVLGAGISGVATVKCLTDVGLKVLCLERSNSVGGLWTFKEKGYGVMSFTHINVSKQNYAFSDFPFPDESIDYVHNSEMSEYVQKYVKNFKVDKHIRFNIQVNSMDKSGEEWVIIGEETKEDERGVITATGKEQRFTCKNVAIATGHHAKPVYPDFPGLDAFTGKTIHSVDYNDAEYNDVVGKRVVVVGIGNSAVDVAGNAASVGKCKPVILSSRSGAWVVPNYVFGSPTDHYACRVFLNLPWRLATSIFETVITIIQGSPKKWNLNPKMHALQTQPTVSPTLVHHIQRGEVKVKPNIKSIEGSTITFSDDSTAEADVLILCTGYKMDLPFLPQYMKAGVLNDNTNEIQLYRNVFAPGVGKSLAFIGFVQPASGGILTMSEIQARWFAELCKDNVFLPSEDDMKQDIRKDMEYVRKRWFHSGRHTIQRDPIIYNDSIAEMIGAKPQISKHPWLAWRLLFSSCGASQWRLQGPGKWDRAEEEVCKVPVTPFMFYGVMFMLAVFLYWVFWIVTYFLDEWYDIEFFD